MRDLGQLNIARTLDEDGVCIASFGDHDRYPKSYVILSKMADPSDDDIRLGQDAPSIEIDGQENSQYDSGLRIIADGDTIHVMFSPSNQLSKVDDGVFFRCSSEHLARALKYIEEKIGIVVLSRS